MRSTVRRSLRPVGMRCVLSRSAPPRPTAHTRADTAPRACGALAVPRMSTCPATTVSPGRTSASPDSVTTRVTSPPASATTSVCCMGS